MQTDANSSTQEGDENINLTVKEDEKESPQDNNEQVNLGVDDTTNQKNETEASEKEVEDGAQTQSRETEPKVDIDRQKVAQLGEQRKSAVRDYLESTLVSKEGIKMAQDKFSKDPEFERYVKTKFGSYYDKITEGESIKEEEKVDIEKIRREERLKAEADFKFKQIEEIRTKLIQQKAEEYGFTSSEKDNFENHVNLLRNGNDVEDEDIIFKKAALITNESKAKAVSPSTSSRVEGGQQESAGEVKNLTLSPRLYDHAVRTGQDPKKLAKDISNLKGIGESVSFKTL